MAHSVVCYRRCSLLIASGGSSWLTYEHLRNRDISSPIANRNESGVARNSAKEPVARITGTQNCRWRKNGNQNNVGYGDGLSAFERLELEAGLVEITFSSGVRVLLEGPATFQVPGDQGAELLIGRMTASVPRGTTGFTVRARGCRSMTLVRNSVSSQMKRVAPKSMCLKDRFWLVQLTSAATS